MSYRDCTAVPERIDEAERVMSRFLRYIKNRCRERYDKDFEREVKSHAKAFLAQTRRRNDPAKMSDHARAVRPS